MWPYIKNPNNAAGLTFSSTAAYFIGGYLFQGILLILIHHCESLSKVSLITANYFPKSAIDRESVRNL